MSRVGPVRTRWVNFACALESMCFAVIYDQVVIPVMFSSVCGDPFRIYITWINPNPASFVLLRFIVLSGRRLLLVTVLHRNWHDK